MKYTKLSKEELAQLCALLEQFRRDAETHEEVIYPAYSVIIEYANNEHNRFVNFLREARENRNPL